MKNTVMYKKYSKRHGGKANVELSFNDLCKIFDDTGVTNKDMHVRLFHAMDDDGSGTIDFKEMSSFCALLANGTVLEKAKFVFRACDTSGSGTLHKPEVR